jgi:hypothetical protein
LRRRRRLDPNIGVGAEEEPGVVVDQVEDLGWVPVGELPGGDLSLPPLVRQIGFEADARADRTLLGLRDDESVALEDPPDRCPRGRTLCWAARW